MDDDYFAAVADDDDDVEETVRLQRYFDWTWTMNGDVEVDAEIVTGVTVDVYAAVETVEKVFQLRKHFPLNWLSYS